MTEGAEDVVLPPSSRYGQIATILRERILGRAYPPGGTLPSAEKLADEFGVTRPTVERAIRQMAAEGLLRAEHGRGTFVIGQFRYAVTVTLPFAGEDWEEGLAGLAKRLREAAAADPACASAPGVEESPGAAVITMEVEGADGGQAVARAFSAVRHATLPAPLDWDTRGAHGAWYPAEAPGQ